jgi:hypothetical protein
VAQAAVLDEYRRRLRGALRRRSLEAAENPQLELMTLLLGAPADVAAELGLEARRRELAAVFSWAVPNARALDVLAEHAPLVECGAGTGYWAALLRARGADIVAYDALPPGRSTKNRYHRDREPWTEVLRSSSVVVARRHSDRTLVLCWPPYGDDAASYHALRAYRGDTLIYIGEPDEGATGSVRFRRELALNWTLAHAVALPRWPKLRDTLMVYERNAVRRPLLQRDVCFACRRFIATGAIGRCDWCVGRRPAALVLQVGRHRVEYLQEMLDAMPRAQRETLERAPNRIR